MGARTFDHVTLYAGSLSGMSKAGEKLETITVTSRTVACDGGDGPLGHPRVYLNMGDDTEIECPYCSRHYVLDENAPAEAH